MGEHRTEQGIRDEKHSRYSPGRERSCSHPGYPACRTTVSIIPQYLPRTMLIVVPFLLLLASCERMPTAGGLVSGESIVDEVDLSLPTEAETRISNGRMTIEFHFKGSIEMEGGQGMWTDREVEPFRKAGQRWLDVVQGPKGLGDFSLRVYVQVKPYEDGLAVASPHFGSVREVNGHYFAEQGEAVFAAYNYTSDYESEFESPRDAEEEFQATIMHELAHISGIGTMWNLDREDGDIVPDDDSPNLRHWVRVEESRGGPYYQEPAGLKAYRETFGDWDFVPILNELGHVFFEDDDNPPRKTLDGRRIPSADEELIGNGIYFTAISAGMLEDLGWEVDYAAVDEYPAGSLSGL